MTPNPTLEKQHHLNQVSKGRGVQHLETLLLKRQHPSDRSATTAEQNVPPIQARLAEGNPEQFWGLFKTEQHPPLLKAPIPVGELKQAAKAFV